jgi:hypothetical protein
MRTMLILMGAILLAGLALAQPAEAACRWTWDCSSGYPCRQVPLCENPLDLPPLPPLGISPIPPPSLRPIPTPMLPPLGTESCEPRYLCTESGQCQWRTVCR